MFSAEVEATIRAAERRRTVWQFRSQTSFLPYGLRETGGRTATMAGSANACGCINVGPNCLTLMMTGVSTAKVL